MTRDVPRLIAVASGKGGTGKSLVAANVAIFLASLGKRVVIVDAALGTPNVHLFVGVPRPSRTLSESLVPGGPTLTELTVATPVPGLRLVGGTSDPAWVAGVDLSAVRTLATQLRDLPADWVVVDLGSGTQPATLELFLTADVPLLVAVPDPTSIELMHRFLRAAFATRLQRLGLGGLVERGAADLRKHEGGMLSALDTYLEAVESRDTRIDALRRAIVEFTPRLIINSVRSKSDMEMGRAVASVARRRLGVHIHYLGHLEYDEAVWAATRRRRPLLTEHPETRVAKNFERVTRGLLAIRDGVRTDHQRHHDDDDVLPSDNHYELLEVPPTASFEDIRRANRRIRDVYGAESVAISGLYDPASLEAVHRRLDLAYTTLMDAAKRKEYDAEMFPEGVPLPLAAPSEAPVPARVAVRASEAAVVAVARPPMPEISARTEFTGTLLRQVREAMGIELREIAERSKIGMAYLQALEGEAYTKLPAPVYVRGFLAEYARILNLDLTQLKDTYLARYRAARGPLADDRDAPSPLGDDPNARRR